jgi:hypothetical protein
MNISYDHTTISTYIKLYDKKNELIKKISNNILFSVIPLRIFML